MSPIRMLMHARSGRSSRLTKRNSKRNLSTCTINVSSAASASDLSANATHSSSSLSSPSSSLTSSSSSPCAVRTHSYNCMWSQGVLNNNHLDDTKACDQMRQVDSLNCTPSVISSCKSEKSYFTTTSHDEEHRRKVNRVAMHRHHGQSRCMCKYITSRMNIFNCISSILLTVTFLILLISTLIPFTSGEAFCPTKCTCIWRHGKQTTNCASQSLISIPSGISGATQVLDLNENNFQILPSKVFQDKGLTNLQKVFLSKCKLGVIADDSLVQLSNLVELDLSTNLLTSVPKDALKETPNLRRLVLSGNPIQSIKKDTFIQISSLNTLDLSFCQISSIEAGAFKGLKSLQFLKLHDNRLVTLLPNVLQDLSPLYTMDLHHNPWNCDCHLRPAREWMIKYNVPLSVPPTCSGPEKLQGMMWNSLELDEFACSPQILSREFDITATVGSNASFTCITRAQPEAKVSWSIEDIMYRNLSSLVNGNSREQNRIVFSEDKSSGPSVVSATLTIHNIELSDSGKSFTCFAENSAGSMSKVFTISVLTSSSAASVGLMGWSKFEIAISIVAILIVILVTFVSIVLWIVRSRRFADDASNSSSDDSANHGKHGHHGHHHHHGGYTTASSDTNSSSVKSSSHSPFPAIDVLKNIPGHSTPSPLSSKEILDSNGHIIAFSNHHHHSNYNLNDHTLSHLTASGQQQAHHSPSTIHHLSSNHMHHHFNQNSLNTPYTLSGHHNLGHLDASSTLEFAQAAGMAVDAYGNASFSPFAGSNTTSHVEMFTPSTLDGHHLHLLPSNHGLMYQSNGQQQSQLHDSSSLTDSQLMLTPNLTTATATLTQVSPHHISPNGTNSSNGGGSTGDSSGQHCDFIVTNASSSEATGLPSNLNVTSLDSIPVSGSCVICEQSFNDLRLHYMEFHEIRECIV